MPLRLDLVRHGDAVAAGESGDASRPLSPAGRRAVADLARFLTGAGRPPDRAFASPALRAQETARILLEGLGVVPETLDELVPIHGPVEVIQALAARSAHEGRELLVGHQPLLSLLAAFLEGGPERPLAPAGLIRLVFHEKPGRGLGRVEVARQP